MKSNLNEDPNYSQKMKTPIILGSVTNWNLQEMLSAQTFVLLLLYYFIKAEFKKLGTCMDGLYTEKEKFTDLLDELHETMIDKYL
jgi:hypothetical protein